MRPMFHVEWESRWRNFAECAPLAFARTGGPIPGELDTRSLGKKGSGASLAIHVLAFALVSGAMGVNLPAKIRLDQKVTGMTIEYIPAEAFPTIEDASGAARGSSGRRGGRTNVHGPQVIRVETESPEPAVVAEFPKELLQPQTDVLNSLVSIPQRLVELRAEIVTPMRAPIALPELSSAVRPPASAKQREKFASLPSLVTSAIAPPSPAVDRPKLPVLTSVLVEAAIAPPSAVRHREQLPSLPSTLVNDVIAPPSTVRHREQLPSLLSTMVSDVVAPPSELGASSTVRAIDIGMVEAIAPPTSTGGGQIVRSLKVDQVDVLAPPASGEVNGQHARLNLDLLSPFRPQVIVVARSNRGTTGLPTQTQAATVTVAPGVGSLPGVGRRGTDNGSGAGTGSGSGNAGVGSGSTSAGRGRGGSDVVAGLDNRLGNGGTGSGGLVSRGGISIENGTVNIGEFTGPAPSKPKELGPRRGHAITVIASSSSGGALNRYGTLKGDKVYTIYLPTNPGLVVMEYSDRPSAKAQSFDEELTAPEPVNVALPAELRRERIIVACVVDREGAVRNVRVVEALLAPLAEKLTQALAQWRFRPALRGDEPIEVDALLGFQIDTR